MGQRFQQFSVSLRIVEFCLLPKMTLKISKLHQPTAGHFAPSAETAFLALKTVLIAGRCFLMTNALAYYSTSLLLR
jgi:hypothetical protein